MDRPSPSRRPPRRIRRGWLVRRALLLRTPSAFSSRSSSPSFSSPTTVSSAASASALESAIFVGLLPVWLVAAKLYGLYDRDEERATHSTADEVVNVFHLITVGVWVFYATSWLVGFSQPEPDEARRPSGCLRSLVVIGCGSVARALARRQPAYVQNALIVGAGDVGQLIARKVLQHPEYGINLVGFVDADPKEPRARSRRSARARAPRRHRRDRPALRRRSGRSSPSRSEAHEQTARARPRAAERTTSRSTSCRASSRRSARTSAVHTHRRPAADRPAAGRASRARRGCSSAASTSSAPRCCSSLTVAAARSSSPGSIRRDSPGPVLFRQTRLGMDMRRFTLLKFRTMRDGHRRRSSPRVHRADHERPLRSRRSNNLYKLDRSDDVTRFGRLAAPDEPRRASAAAQRPARRHVARRPAAVHPVRARALRAAPLRAVPRSRRA